MDKHSGIEIKNISILLFLFLINTRFLSITSGESSRLNDLSVNTGLGQRNLNYLEYKSDFIEGSFPKINLIVVSITPYSLLDSKIADLVISDSNKFLLPDTISKSDEDQYIKFLSEDKFKGGRAARWYYAWVIFKDYPWYKKLFGGGFDYLEMFGKKFGEAEYDYPHNPFISAFLYSGIAGGLLYIWFMIIVFYYYVKYWRHHIYFFICFLVVFFFSFVSANTHFSIPIFAFFSFIPFLTKYLVKKEYLQNSKNNNE